MESFKGVSFEDWAAANANMAHGMSADEMINILGVEMPVWTEVNTYWGEKMADIMATDMAIATRYGEIFQNPKVGKFANASADIDMDKILSVVPDFDTYAKIMHHTNQAGQVGEDVQEVLLKEYGLTVAEWATGGAHWAKWLKDEDNYASMSLLDKWQTHYEEVYKDKGANLGEDIDF